MESTPHTQENKDEDRKEGMDSRKLVLLRLTLVTTSIYVIGALLSAWLAYDRVNAVMMQQNEEKLQAVLKSRAVAVEELFRVTREHAALLAEDEMIIAALKAFTFGFSKLEQDLGLSAEESGAAYADVLSYYSQDYVPSVRVAYELAGNGEELLPHSISGRLAQWVYIAQNPNPIGSKDKLHKSVFESTYETAHRLYHPRLNKVLQAFDYHDVFLFDLEGNLTYSTAKEVDFGTNFVDGPYAASGLGQAIRSASASSRTGDVIITDFSHYGPSGGEPAAFLAAPVIDENVAVGVVAFQLHTEKLNRVVSDLHGLGTSGETYIVGKDLLMRSDSRFSDESTILETRVDTISARRVTGGQTGTLVAKDYRGVEVLSHFMPLSIAGLDWAIIGEVDESDVLAPAAKLSLTTSGIFAVTLLIVGLVSIVTLRLCVIRPLKQLLINANALRKGNYSSRVYIITQDEFSVLADSHNRMAEAIQAHVVKLENALSEVRELRGLLPICASCKSIRDGDGYFKTVESYLVSRANIEFTHTICETCVPLLYPELSE